MVEQFSQTDAVKNAIVAANEAEIDKKLSEDPDGLLKDFFQQASVSTQLNPPKSRPGFIAPGARRHTNSAAMFRAVQPENWR